MKLDRRLIDTLLSMSDEKLTMAVRGLSSGLSHSGDIDPRRISGIRGMLSELTDHALERVSELLTVYKNSKGGRRNG